MASEFIGFKITVTLHSPPNAKLQGTVANVVGQQLVLRDVVLFWNGQRFPSYVVDSTRIADLEVTPDQRNENVAPSPAPAGVNPVLWENVQSQGFNASNIQVPKSSTPSASQSFVDPAILSYAKPKLETKSLTPQIPPLQPPVRSPVMIGDSVASRTPTTVVFQQQKEITHTETASATLDQPFDSLTLGNGASKPVPHDAASVVTAKAGRKKNKPSAAVKAEQDRPSRTGPGIIDVKDLDTSLMVPKKTGRGKGWRQTPLIEEAAPSKSRHIKNKKSLAEDPNGWATEDATDIQDMGDFDFESNLNKFDKRRVFDDIRSKDKTAVEDRLVSHNRQVRPGTNGGKNLHYTENVLDAPDVTNQWKSEAGETEEEFPEERYSSSRASRREHSKAARAPSRKGSTLVNQNLPSTIMSRTGSTRTESPRPMNRVAPTPSPMNGLMAKGTFRLAESNKPCTTVTPLQMLEIEQVCTAELGLTEDMLTENAGRGIAEVTLRHTDIAVPSGNILVLAGNHKSGARAISAARHLRNRNMRVSLCILGGDREDLLLETMKRQLDIYRRSGGRVVKWDEVQSKLSEWSPHLIIDALLGMHAAFDDLRLDHQANTFEMIKWMNRSDIPIFSVEVPSGLIASTGEVTETDSGPLIADSAYVISLGAPKNCLLDASARDGESPWQVYVVDIGISNAAWKKYGTRRRHGVEFGKHWTIDLIYQA